MQFSTQRRVEFRDTDAAGILHFTAFFGCMESVEHEFLRSLGYSVVMFDELGKISWPRVSAHCDYQGSVRFEDVLDVELSVARLGEKSATYRFLFQSEGRQVATGEVTTVCCRMTADGPQSMPIPTDLRTALAPYAAQVDPNGKS